MNATELTLRHDRDGESGASKSNGRQFIVAGLILQLSVFVGVAGTTFGMWRAFQVLGSGGTAIADPASVSTAIGEALLSTFIGLLGNNLGAGLILFALWRYRLRSADLFWTGIALGVTAFPLGIAVMIYCLVHRHEFGKSAATKSQDLSAKGSL